MFGGLGFGLWECLLFRRVWVFLGSGRLGGGGGLGLWSSVHFVLEGLGFRVWCLGYGVQGKGFGA